MAREIEIQRLGIGGVADQPFQHADHFGTFLVDGRGVEVVDFLKTLRPDRVGEGAVVFWELARAQVDRIADPLDRGRAHVRGELAVAIDGQTFLETKLEPVTAGDAVAGPVVEIFMCDDRLDPLKIHVGRGFRAGKNRGGVEDVQPLVLHRAHVEIVHGDDVENVEVVFTAIDILVPFHRLLQGLHAKGAFALVPGAHVKVQRHVAPADGGETVGMRHQVTCDQREEVGGLGPGIMPFGPAVTRFARIAVRQQYRQVAVDAHGKDAHHVGPVGVIGDLAKSLRLALRAIHAVGHIQPFQRGIALGVDLDLRLPDKGRIRRITA